MNGRWLKGFKRERERVESKQPITRKTSREWAQKTKKAVQARRGTLLTCPRLSEEAHEVAREDVSPGLPPALVEQLAAPPPVFGRRGDSDDIALLEVKLLVDRRAVVVHSLNCTTTCGVSSQTSSSMLDKRIHTIEQHTAPVVRVLSRRRRLATLGWLRRWRAGAWSAVLLLLLLLLQGL